MSEPQSVHVTTRTVVVDDPVLRMCYQVTVPARTEEDAWHFLMVTGSGGVTGAGLQNLYLGASLPAIRQRYYQALERVEKEIAQRRIAMGARLSNSAELRAFTQWASQQRTDIARLWRLPAGPGGLIGGEIRDWRQYGLGGRTLNNLVHRAEGQGHTGDAALLKVLRSVDKPSPAATEYILKGARHLKSAGAVFFVGGAALTLYNIYSAPEGQRGAVAAREGISLAGGAVAGNVAVGVCFLLGMTGVGLLVVGVVAGVAGGMLAERVFYAHEGSQAVQQLKAGQPVSVHHLSPQPHH